MSILNDISTPWPVVSSFVAVLFCKEALTVVSALAGLVLLYLKGKVVSLSPFVNSVLKLSGVGVSASLVVTLFLLIGVSDISCGTVVLFVVAVLETFFVWASGVSNAFVVMFVVVL